MKTNTLIIGTVALALNISACQNRAIKSDDESTSMTDNTHMMDTTMAMGGMMKGSMDKMMQDMHQMTMTGNMAADFAMMMKSHHEGGIAMAKEELRSGTDDELKQIAQKIIDKQTSEVNELQSYIDSRKNPEKNYDPAKKDEGFGKHMSENMNMMMNMPKIEAGASVDKQFAQMMIAHHQSGIHMAEGYVQYGKDQALLTMAKKMIEDEKKEIEELKKWDESHK